MFPYHFLLQIRVYSLLNRLCFNYGVPRNTFLNFIDSFDFFIMVGEQPFRWEEPSILKNYVDLVIQSNLFFYRFNRSNQIGGFPLSIYNHRYIHFKGSFYDIF